MICSFCSKAQAEVRKLIAGPTVYICDECVALCNGIIAEIPQAPALYVSSRVAHMPMWRERRAAGCPIISSWIDFDEIPTDRGAFWENVEAEIKRCSALVLYAAGEADFPFKGALVEVGMALAHGKRVCIALENVVLDGPTMRPIGSWIHHPNVIVELTLADALARALRP